MYIVISLKFQIESAGCSMYACISFMAVPNEPEITDIFHYQFLERGF